jgi:hypothetical protein
MTSSRESARDVLISIVTLRDVVRSMVGETAYPLERQLSKLVKDTYAQLPGKTPTYEDPITDLLRVSDSVDVDVLQTLWTDYRRYFNMRVRELKRVADEDLVQVFDGMRLTKSPRRQPELKREPDRNRFESPRKTTRTNDLDEFEANDRSRRARQSLLTFE